MLQVPGEGGEFYCSRDCENKVHWEVHKEATIGHHQTAMAGDSETPGAASKYAYGEELVTPEATAAAAAALQTMRDSSDLVGRLRPAEGREHL